jgi:hypothetical protein
MTESKAKGPHLCGPFWWSCPDSNPLQITLTCGNTQFEYAKRCESTRNDVRIREGVDGINKTLRG